MGIISSIIGRIGLPVAALAVAGFLLFTFRDRILGAIGGGAEVVGQAITQPLGSFLQGIQTGFSNIPQQIEFRLPSFDFIFGQSDPSNDPIGQLQKDFDDFLKNSQAFLDNLFKGSQGGSGTVPPPIPTTEETAGGSLTPFAKSFITTTSTGGEGQVTSRETLEQILARNREAVGLFDFKFTEQTEFFALSQAEIDFFGGQEELIFSGQLFKEIKNIQEAINFA